MTDRDKALGLLTSEAWLVEDKPQIISDCGVRLVSGGEYEAIDRAFVAGAELAFGVARTEKAEASS